MGTQCVDRRCVTKVDPCRSLPRPCGRRVLVRSSHRRRPSRRLPALTGVPMTPVCAGSHVDGRALRSSMAFHPHNSHCAAGATGASGFLTVRRLLPRLSVKTPIRSVARTSRCGTAIMLHNQCAEHSTTPTDLTVDRRITANASCLAPSGHPRRHRMLLLLRRIYPREGIETPIRSGEPAVWQSKPKLRSLRMTLASRAGELADAEAPLSSRRQCTSQAPSNLSILTG
jgi:hypothetical protein